MGDKSKSVRILNPANARLSGQDKVNAEIFTAVEIIGRKLERVEAERDRLARRLALIESAATVDEKTGKLYLPVVMDPPLAAAQPHATPKWMVSASLMSSAIALFALGLVVFRDPAPALTQDQVALLESLRGINLAQVSPDSHRWKNVDTDNGLAENTAAATPEAASAEPAPATQAQAEPVAAPVVIAATPEPAKVEEAPAAIVVEAQSTLAPATEKEIEKPAARIVTKAEPKLEPKIETAIAPPPTEKLAEAPAEKIVKTAEADSANTVSKSEKSGGIAPDAALPEKVAELEKRAYQGVAEAQHDLATLYAAGKIIPQDYKRANFWFAKAADGGIANANYNLGVIYHQGLGVPVDMAKALDWYKKAAELGHPEAMYNLGIAYIEGVGTATDTAKGVDYFKRAANAGVAQAAYNLGVLYESNFIGQIDTKKAIEWYQVAAQQGHADARAALTRLNAGTATADSGDQALTLADMAEPAAGGNDAVEETGEGDSSPVSETSHAAARNGTLADIQRILAKQGLMAGKADGAMNPQTEDAIRAAQKKLGLNEDGQPSQQLLDKLLQLPPVARP